MGDEYVLDGAKRWIGNASFADVTVIWARDDQGDVGAYLVAKGTPGFDASSVISGKIGKRVVWQAEISLNQVRVPLENRHGHDPVADRRTRCDRDLGLHLTSISPR